jgi:PTH1 family peptidyl-tRNA hydrolase
MKIIVGLGNPGDKYNLTRHNAGFMAVDAIADRFGLAWVANKKFKAEIAISTLSSSQGERGGGLILIKPQTYMNNSGEAVRGYLSFYKLLPKNLGIIRKKDSDLSELLTVIHDDLDIDLGRYKISTDSRSAGHKGAESIINHLKTKNFTRIRIGIKTPLKEKIPGDKFVLQKFSEEELKTINQTIVDIINNCFSKL